MAWSAIAHLSVARTNTPRFRPRRQVVARQQADTRAKSPKVQGRRVRWAAETDLARGRTSSETNNIGRALEGIGANGTVRGQYALKFKPKVVQSVQRGLPAPERRRAWVMRASGGALISSIRWKRLTMLFYSASGACATASSCMFNITTAFARICLLTTTRHYSKVSQVVGRILPALSFGRRHYEDVRI
jgi:hypothetical protein